MTGELEKLLKLIRPYSKRVYIAVVLSLFVSGVNGAIAWLVKPVMDSIFVQKKYELLSLLPVGIVVLFVLRGLGALLQTYYMETAGFKLVKDLRSKYLEVIVSLPVSTVQKWSSGEVISRVISDIQQLSRVLTDSFRTFLIQIPSLIVLMGVAIYRRWDVAALSFILLPLIAFVTKKMSYFLKMKRKDVQQAMALITHRMNECIQGIKVLKIFTLERLKAKQFVKENQRYYHQVTRLLRIREGTKFVTEVLSGLSVAIIVGYGGYLVVNGAMSSGDFFSILTAIVMAFAPLKKLGKAYGTFQESVGVLERIEDFMSVEPEKGGARIATPLERNIVFDGVSFSYFDNSEPVLHDIHCVIPAGKTFALVGPSGAGKSTFVDLIPRFYTPTKGRILWDGVAIEEFDLLSLRRLIGIVTQDIVLFSDTIRENIAYGRPEATQEEIERAAKMAQAHDFIMALPEGYETRLDERGLNLSGGQRQRIAIARALLKDPPLLIMDEATSALDTISEQAVQKAIGLAKKGRTTIIIAHRMSTILDADFIAVMDQGKIIDIGNHSELLTRNDLYRELYRQMSSKKE